MERVYTIPLREVKKTPKSKRAPKAIRYIRRYLEKHAKSDKIILDNSVNEKVWERGIKNMPSKIKVKVETVEDDIILVTLAE
ncbi:MAG: 50S ribosomal protein L31e [Candidatus Hydrothermarchaeales archaeon]